MNSAEESIKDDNSPNDQDSLKEQIEELERLNHFLENELIIYRRRLWQDFQEMVCMAHILVKLEEVFGEDKVGKIVEDFMENEKAFAMQAQSEMAKEGNWRWEYTDIERLFS